MPTRRVHTALRRALARQRRLTLRVAIRLRDAAEVLGRVAERKDRRKEG